MGDGVVIVGGGQAGFQTASSLRSEGFDGPIHLICEEASIPYQRPPLSKGFVVGKQDYAHILLRPESYYREHEIQLTTGQKVVSIDRAFRRVRLASGERIPYDFLVLAIGARNRTLGLPGADMEGVCYLRTLAEATKIKRELRVDAERVVVIGGGFIGLEIAASARTLGKSVSLLEAQPRLMGRVVAPVVSEFFRAAHTVRGVHVLLGCEVQQIRGSAGVAREVLLRDGSTLPADLVVVGIGVMPNTELASDAGLDVVNGISVDEFLRTRDERIFAIGDCAEYLNAFAAAGTRVRLESVQNAVDQAVCVARNIAGKPAAYHAAPWFWSDQFDLRLQMVGLPAGHDQVVVRGDVENEKFSVFYFREGRLCAVDSVNRPVDHMAARKIIGEGTVLTPDQAADENFRLVRKPG